MTHLNFVLTLSGRCRRRERGRGRRPDRPRALPRQQRILRLRHRLPAGVHLQAQALHLIRARTVKIFLDW